NQGTGNQGTRKSASRRGVKNGKHVAGGHHSAKASSSRKVSGTHTPTHAKRPSASAARGGSHSRPSGSARRSKGSGDFLTAVSGFLRKLKELIVSGCRSIARGFRRLKPQVRLALIGIIAAIVLVLCFRAFACHDTSVASGQPVTIVVAEGSSTKTIAAQLEEAGVIDSGRTFTNYVKNHGQANALKPGTYSFVTGMDESEVAALLVAGPASEGNLVIPEGVTLKETAEVVHGACPQISVDEFVQLAKTGAPRYAADYPFLANAYNDSLEGYLFPKTYEVSEGATADDVIRMQLDQFAKETQDIDYSYAKGKGLSQSDVITIASIIEEEAYIDEDRPKIASVIYNRLAKPMRLQLDSTVIYALDGKAGEHLSTEDTRVESPYNTYINNGLPPGPISSPGRTSIEAAAQPAQTDYLYYVLTSRDGSQTFTNNYDDFLKAKEKYKEVFGVN
ncbi:MAG: endolytic transglycosylase MltG, partial [Actinomycetota bacterium]|nr:endolytic transglycosylase MltG [Actinomycetota bacterium]